MKHLPLDISTFSTMIREGYLYVDKTEHIYNLFLKGRRFFFLSRPRRFGKSLLVSTLKELFQGNQSLFEDLWIVKHGNWDWIQYPVIHIDFSNIAYDSASKLEMSLQWTLDQIAQLHNVDISQGFDLKSKLKLLVEKLSLSAKVVVLIDEYDKPIIDNLDDIRKAQDQRKVLKSFYDGFKGLDAHLKALFITGVSKFSKASVFSGLNNLNDITNESLAAELVGYTEAELRTYFESNIVSTATKFGTSPTALLEKIRTWYNGYQFSIEPIKVYNPLSIVYFFSNQRFENYWIETGTSSFLIDLLKKNKNSWTRIEEEAYKRVTLGSFAIDKLPLVTLLYQTGYLTIKEYDEKFDMYRLGYPNEEVRQSLLILEMSVLTQTDSDKTASETFKLKKSLENEDVETFLIVLQGLFAGISYNLHVAREAYYHSIFKIICDLLGVENHCEVSTSKGKIDLVVITEKLVYIFEFKLSKTASEALEQMHSKKYYDSFKSMGKKIILVGVSFRFKRKELTFEWQSEYVT